MGKTAKCVSLFMAVSGIFLIDFGWGLKLTVSPVLVTTIAPADFSLSCEFEASEISDIKNSRTAKLQAMSIAHHGASSDQWIAIVHVNKQAVTLASSVQAIGHVQEDGRNSYLHVNITGLQLAQAEDVTCFTYDKRNRELKKVSRTIVAIGLPTSFSTTLHQFLTLTYLSTEETDYALRLGFRQAKKTLQELKKNIDNQKRILDGMILRNSLTVHFRALIDSGFRISKNQIVYFRKVVINEGKGYNNRRGKFRVPYTGYYLFQIGWHVSTSNWQFIDIRANSRVLTRIGGMAYSWRNYAEGSVVAKLYRGADVYPYVFDASHSNIMETRDSNGYINHFSGYLMKSL